MNTNLSDLWACALGCRDLLETRHLRLVKVSYSNVASSVSIYGWEMPKNKTVKGSKDKLLSGRKKDCYFSN